MPDTIPEKALVVIADGGKALLFRRTGSGDAVTLREERRLTPDDTREQGPSGSRPEDQTEKQTKEASFVNHLAHDLHTMHQRGDFDAMVLVADPQTLGQLRACLHKTVERTVIHTMAEDLTNHSLKAIEDALAAH